MSKLCCVGMFECIIRLNAVAAHKVSPRYAHDVVLGPALSRTVLPCET